MTHISFRRFLGGLALSVGAVVLGSAPSASAHSNTVACVDQATSTWRITNDYPLSETFTSLEGPSGSVAAGNGSYTDVVYNGDTLTVTGTWTDGFTQTTDGAGDCTPEGGTTTTTEAPTTTTELVTTTTAQETTTSLLETTTTTEPSTTTSPTVTTLPTTTSEPSTSSSVATSSTTSTLPTTSPSTSSSTLPAPSSTTPAPTTLPPECSDNPTTPTDDCAPICQPVTADINGDGDTTDAGENSCYQLPATGSDTSVMTLAAIMLMLSGGALVLIPKRR